MSKAETSYLYYYFCLDVINVCKFTEVQELIKGLFSFSYLLLAKMKERTFDIFQFQTDYWN